MTRELIDRNSLNIPSDDNYYDDLVQFVDDVMDAEVVTEQVVIKPYLQKLKEEIEEKFGHCDICEYIDDYDWEENDISHYDSVGSITDILSMIDSILSEQCEEKQKDKCESCFTKKLTKEKWVSAEDCKECKKNKDEKSCDKCVHVNESEPTKHNCATCKDMDNYEEK